MNRDEPENTESTAHQSLEELEGNDSLLKEFWTFLMENKIWWITPTVLILLLVFGFIIITAVTGSGPMAPFIYTLF
jgi:hypothetical protein